LCCRFRDLLPYQGQSSPHQARLPRDHYANRDLASP
jgi:hypothetical protein